MSIRVLPEEYTTSDGDIYTTCPDCGTDQTVSPGIDQECWNCGTPYRLVVEWAGADAESTERCE